MKLYEIDEVVKASPAIQIQSKISLLQRRAWNVLLANAYNDLPDKDIYTIGIVELAAKLGFNSGNRNYLKDMLKSLVDCTVEWNMLGKDKEEEWGVASLLASARIKDGICTYGFAPHLRLKLHNPRIYAKLNLRLQNRFKNQYALVLWEVCFDYFDTERGQGETPFIPLTTFRDMIGLESGEYPVFGFLNRDVIKPAIREINKLTNFSVVVEQKRHGRRIAELKFRITKIKQPPVQESLFPDIENLPPVAVELIQAQVDRKVALQVAERAWDFVLKEKVPASGTYPDFMAYVAEKIEMSLNATGIKNRAGFILNAIRENYQNASVQKARELRAEKVRDKELEELTAEFRIKCDNILRQVIHTQPELVEQAAERIQSHMIRKRLLTHDTVMDAYQKGGMIKAEIDGILTEELCADALAPARELYETEKARVLAGEQLCISD